MGLTLKFFTFTTSASYNHVRCFKVAEISPILQIFEYIILTMYVTQYEKYFLKIVIKLSKANFEIQFISAYDF